MSVLHVLEGELREARARQLQVARVRITDAALEGSPVTVLISPERARIARLSARDLERVREIVIHPADWNEVLLEKHDGRYLVTADEVFGVAVVA